MAPSVAWVELGGGPMCGGNRRRLTMATAEALWADRLFEDERTADGTEHSAKARWTPADVSFHLRLLRAAGYDTKEKVTGDSD